MWISKKKYENDLRKAANEATFKFLDSERESTQWEDIEKLKKQVKKLKKWVKNGY
jgi:hypothetical protein